MRHVAERSSYTLGRCWEGSIELLDEKRETRNMIDTRLARSRDRLAQAGGLAQTRSVCVVLHSNPFLLLV